MIVFEDMYIYFTISLLLYLYIYNIRVFDGSTDSFILKRMFGQSDTCIYFYFLSAVQIASHS